MILMSARERLRSTYLW